MSRNRKIEIGPWSVVGDREIERAHNQPVNKQNSACQRLYNIVGVDDWRKEDAQCSVA